jgi:serine/threonine-protein kinase RsbT
MDEFDGLRRTLERYLSPMIARSMLQRAMRERNLLPERFGRADVYKIAPLIRRGLVLFVSEHERAEALAELDALCEQARPTVAACHVNITSENDISVVRNEARRLCEDVGAETYTIQKVTTIVSELARNIVNYANRGKLELVPIQDADRRIVVRASDEGSGIPNLELVLSGRYRSKTGLGRGLLGTKRLADRFDVKTGPTGTLVVAEVVL